MEPYEPKQLPPDCIDWPAHVTLIGQANAALARYDGMLQSTEIIARPHPDFIDTLWR